MRRRLVGPAVLGVAILLAAGGSGWGAAQGPPAAAGTPGAAARPPAGPDRAAGAEAHFELGEMYHRQVFEALDLAIKGYEEAIKLQADHAQAHYNLALAYHSKAKLESDDQALYRKALQEYKLYLRYSPNGELAAKAKQNITAVETMLGGARAGAAAAPKRARPRKAPGGQQ